MDRELLLEIGVEELPAAWLPGLTRQLSEKLALRLKEMRLQPDVPVESYATPRRLTACVSRMPERQEDLDETVGGPSVSAAFNAAGDPTPAAIGFAKKQGVAVEALERVKTDKGEYIAARKHVRGKSTVDALPELLGAVLRVGFRIVRADRHNREAARLKFARELHEGGTNVNHIRAVIADERDQ